MIWFLFAMGVLWIMLGTLTVFATDVARERYYDKLKTKDPRLLSPAAIIVGVLFLLSASSSSLMTFIVILGLLSLAKGLFFLFGPREKTHRVINWWFEASDRTQKAWGVVMMVVGIAVLSGIVS